MTISLQLFIKVYDLLKSLTYLIVNSFEFLKKHVISKNYTKFYQAIILYPQRVYIIDYLKLKWVIVDSFG